MLSINTFLNCTQCPKHDIQVKKRYTHARFSNIWVFRKTHTTPFDVLEVEKVCFRFATRSTRWTRNSIKN